MQIGDLEIYQIARKLSGRAWAVYVGLQLSERKIVGDQFLRSIDSMGANIAEGWGRFYFLDRNRFNYHARRSLLEAIHWVNLLIERKIIGRNLGEEMIAELELLRYKLNNYIRITKKQAGK